MQHMTMDDDFEREFDEVCWTYYTSCLPKSVQAHPHRSPEDAVTLLDRYQIILAERIRVMAIHERDLHDLRFWSPGI